MTTTNVALRAVTKIAIIIIAAATTALAVPQLPSLTPLSSSSSRDSFVEKPWGKLSDTELTNWGKLALEINAAKWKHGETEHFVIHFFYNGDMIARRSEKFYAEIREFFGNRKARAEGHKSHAFAFYETSDWDKFKSGVQLEKHVAGVARGNEFFYMPVNENKQFDSRGQVQAHEMTHLVFNRFFTGAPPLWLNEGVAVYFGLKKTTDATTFRRQAGYPAPFGVEKLFMTKQYPEKEDDVRSFYAESTIVVDFLTQTADRRALLTKFIDAMIADDNVDEALKVYGFKTRADFLKAYDRHRSLFHRH